MPSRLFQNIGPGVITAALVFGPGSLTVNTKLGAEFGYNLLWVIAFSIIFMISFTRLSAVIGCNSEWSIMQIINRRYGRTLATLLGLGIFAISASFQAGNAIGAGIAFNHIFGGDQSLWIIMISVVAIALVFSPSFYRILERVMLAMVLLMLLAFVLTFIMSRPSISDVFTGLAPKIPQESSLLIVALVASSFSIVGAFYQSYLVQAKGWKHDNTGRAKQESLAGILILGLLSSVVMMSAASILHPQNLPVNHASDLGLALTPLFGPVTTYIFMAGLFAASFTSLLGNATIGGTILSDSLGWGHELRSNLVKKMIVAVVVTGSLVAIVFGRLPLQLIVFAQAITILVAPTAAIALLLIANSREVMGSAAYKGTQNLLPSLGLITLLLLALFHLTHFIQ